MTHRQIDDKKLAALRPIVYGRGKPCCRCGQAIDYTLVVRKGQGKPNPMAPTMDHYPWPLSLRPDLAYDLGNLAASHWECNVRAQDKIETPLSFTTSRRW